jgi:hypothetical protein
MRFLFAPKLTGFVIVLLMAGCASGPERLSFDKEKAPLLHNAYIELNVKKPSAAFLNTGSPGTAGMPLATLMTTDTSKLSKAPIQALLDREKIDISEIVRAEAQQILSKKSSVRLTARESAKVIFRFTVESYGLSKTHPFGSVYDANVSITASLVTSEGKLIWQVTDWVSGLALDNKDGRTLDVYYARPETLKTALSTASRIVVKRLISNLPD